ncbi:MAG: S8 family peptidase [Cellulosilyticaceae bacterium]
MSPKVDPTIDILGELSDSSTTQLQEELKQQGVIVGNMVQVIVKYNGDIVEVARQEGGSAQLLSEQFAVLTMPVQNIKNLNNYTQVEYVEVPHNFVYNLQYSMTAACIRQVQERVPYNLKGSGVLLGIIDSGITYTHPDFRNADGTTRIARLWDQSVKGIPPKGFDEGTEYSRAQINEALAQKNKAAQLEVVPSVDTIGHGTHVAGIAGGNGRGSGGAQVGAAPEAEFVIVKLKQSTSTQFVRTIDIMLGVKYVVEKAIEIGRPMAINLSLGMNEGSHDGQSLIEQYLAEMAQKWKLNIVVGAGNEGVAENHTKGVVKQGGVSSFQFQIGPNKKSYQFSMWQSFIDTMEVQIVSPSGQKTPRITYAQGPSRFVLDNVAVYASFSSPSPLNGDIEFVTILKGINDTSITTGIWTVNVYGMDIVDGTYNVWGETSEQAGKDVFFLNPEVNTTITTPATSSYVISVGAYNTATNQIAPFSGRGYTRGDKEVKPDLVAPGVDILAPSNSGGYQRLSGTSMATPHVTGAIALMMEWGIVKKNNVFLYGASVRTYLLRGTKKDVTGVTFPDPRWGYGKLCLKNTMDIMRRNQVL